jgi:hypothetical protein
MARRSFFLRELPCNKLSEPERSFAHQKAGLNLNPHGSIHYVVLPIPASDISGPDETTKHRRTLNEALGRQGYPSLNPVFVDFTAVDDGAMDRDVAAQRQVGASFDDDEAWGQSQASSSSASSGSTSYPPRTSATMRSSVRIPTLSS